MRGNSTVGATLLSSMGKAQGIRVRRGNVNSSVRDDCRACDVDESDKIRATLLSGMGKA